MHPQIKLTWLSNSKNKTKNPSDSFIAFHELDFPDLTLNRIASNQWFLSIDDEIYKFSFARPEGQLVFAHKL